jgi:hypothetical protein
VQSRPFQPHGLSAQPTENRVGDHPEIKNRPPAFDLRVRRHHQPGLRILNLRNRLKIVRHECDRMCSTWFSFLASHADAQTPIASHEPGLPNDRRFEVSPPR